MKRNVTSYASRIKGRYTIARYLELPKRSRANQTDFNRRLVNLMLDKEQRGTIAALGTAAGLSMIGGYYLSIGETPDVSVGQASLLVLEAFVVGVLFVVGLCVATFSPALAFHLSDINVDAISMTNRRQLLSLFRRSVTAQVGGIAFATVLIISPEPGVVFNIWLCAIPVVVVAAVLSLLLEKTKGESVTTYWRSILAIAFYGALSAILAFSVYWAAQERISEWRLMYALIFLVIASAGLSLVGLARWKTKVIGMLVSIGMMMWILDSTSFVFRVTAYQIGIARSRPAMLTLPKEVCFSLQPLLRKTVLDCTSEITVLNQVLVLSSLGERWIIREIDSKENISFVAKGVGIRNAAK